ncbi:XRE family transcriptional regulator [alpha proteobacterium AAP38]|uniref:helix-turn-helix domain-containing protein n=1 Tax=Niveispirillum sp. TaxID=1917217 RepID=UPI0006B8FA9F|nr:XRE family transcriptional regulator [alpha proteobacterium AAP38]
MTAEKQGFGEALLESLAEVVAWKKGEMALEVVDVDAMPPERVRAIRHAVAKSTREFERRFGIPAATMNNWEQGRRKPDPAARILLQVIEKSPEMVASVVAGD